MACLKPIPLCRQSQICRSCGVTFTAEYLKQSCSRPCQRGSKHRDARPCASKPCEQCGAPTAGEYRYCSRACYDATLPPRVVTACAECGTPVVRTPSQKGPYCGWDCYNVVRARQTAERERRLALKRAAAAQRLQAIHDRSARPLKRCSECEQEKPRTEFNRAAKTFDGLKFWCRACCRAKKKVWHQTNKADQNRQTIEYYKAHGDTIRARHQANYRLDLEGMRQRSKDWYAKNKDLARERGAQYRLKKPWRAYRAKNPAKAREQCRRQQARRWHAARMGEAVSYADIYARDGGICYLCCEPVTFKAAHFDHVIALVNGGPHTYDNIRPTHARCNLRKSANVVAPGAYAKA